jgi:hypothetical protein
MKSLKKAVVAIALAIGVGFLATPARAGQCSNAKSAGNYGLTLSGTLIIPGVGPAPIAAVVRAKLEADGTVSGTEARNVGGEYADETFTGTFTVNTDCTGTTTLNFFEAGQLVRISVLSFVIDDDSTEIRMVQKSLTLPNGATIPVILTAEGRRISRNDED